jgi:thioredoxin-like negative regulator of GroEL
VIERLLIAVLILAAIGAAGYLFRMLAAARSARLAARSTLQPSETAGTRLLLFSSTDCAACVTQRRVIEETRESWPHPVEISYHDAVVEGELARQFGIMIVPSVVVAAADGRIVGVKQGLVDEDRLRSLIEAAA